MKMKIVLSLFVLALLVGCDLITPATRLILRSTPTPAIPLPAIILTQVLAKLDGCISDNGVEIGENAYFFRCRNSADTGYSVTMTRFESEPAARSQFEASRGDHPVSCFHGYDMYEASSGSSSNKYIIHQRLGWLAGSWVISIQASFDYGYFHFTPADFSEAVYSSAIEHDLFPAATCP